MLHTKKLLIILFIFLSLSIFICYKLNPYSGSTKSPDESLDLSDTITKKQAIKDIDYVEKKILEKHVSTVDGIPKKLKDVIDEEKDSLDDEVTVLRLWQSISRILSVFNDAHTNIKPVLDNDYIIGYDFYMDDKDLFMYYDDNTRRRVFSINGKSVEDLYDEFLQKFSYENDYYAHECFCNYVKYYSGLEFLGIIDDSEDYVTLRLESKEDKSKIVEDKVTFLPASEVLEKEKFYFSIDPLKKAAILTINKCENSEDYKKIISDFFFAVNDNSIDNIAVDLRYNSGGDSAVIDEFMKYIDVDSYKWFKTETRYGEFVIPSKQNRNNKNKNIKYSGNIYVLTSNRTFSSAMMFSVVLQDNNIAKVIGEPSGNKPSSYGDSIKFSLPNSKLLLTVSHKKFTRPNLELSDEESQDIDYPCDEDKAVDEFYKIAVE